MDNEEKFSGWCIVEIMGHKKFAGFVSEQVVGGAAFVRVDVPACGDIPAFTKMFGAASIYCITPTSEEYARLAVPRIYARPLDIYMPELYPQPEPRAIAAEVLDDEDPYADDENSHIDQLLDRDIAL